MRQRSFPSLTVLSVGFASLFVLSSCEKPELASAGAGEPDLEEKPLVLDAAEEKMAPEVATGDSDLAAYRPINVAGSLGDDPDAPQFPYLCTIKNHAGVELMGQILAKSGSEIAFRRGSDRKLFIISAETLADESQQLVNGFRDEEQEKLELAKNPQATIAAAEPPKRRPLLGQGYDDNVLGALERAKESDRDVMVFFLGRGSASSADCAPGGT